MFVFVTVAKKCLDWESQSLQRHWYLQLVLCFTDRLQIDSLILKT